jgi:hypothetical protein
VDVLLSIEPRVSGNEFIEPVVTFAEPWKDVRDRNLCPTSIPHVTIVDCH